jgi:uncharacterized protein YfdQ (DUF2303 family)
MSAAAELAGSASDMQAVIDAARIGDSVRIGETHLAFPLPEGGHVQMIDVEAALSPYMAHPRRKTGTYRVHDAASFAAYLYRHGTEDTEVWSDSRGSKIVGVINAHEAASGPVGAPGPAAGWGDHRVVYAVEQTKAWQAWIARDGQLLSQSDFAELIEDRAVDIVRPAAAEMLELAQTFQATIGVEFGSSKLLSSGERQLEYRETVDAKAGRAGKLEIPRDFDLALIPFEGAKPFRITARFRYRITDGTLRVGYRLTRPDVVLREAFESVVTEVAGLDGTPDVIFRGVPAG